MAKKIIYFDSKFDEKEQLPRDFIVNFESIKIDQKTKTKVSVNGIQTGDLIDDNSLVNDGYRFHDVFHFTFASILGWSPCTRAMMKLKRKSNPIIDEVEDGARATITEESISLLIFNIAKQYSLFKDQIKVEPSLLCIIKEMTRQFEVSIRSEEEWEEAILVGYSLFRKLVDNNGGKIHFNMLNHSAIFEN